MTFQHLPKAELQEAEQVKLASMERKRQGAICRSCDVNGVVVLEGMPMFETTNAVKQRKNGWLQMRPGTEDVREDVLGVSFVGGN